MSTSIQDAVDSAVNGFPPAKRQRMLSKACETCKLKKSRCDSSRPRCDTCRRKGVECIYREKGQPGLRPGYGKGIEHRLSLLEEGMEKMNQKIDDALNTARTFGPNNTLPPVDQEAPGTRTPYDTQLWQTSQQQPEEFSFNSSPVMERMQFSSMPGPSLDNSLPPNEMLQELAELFFELVYPWTRLFYKPSFMANLFLPERQILLHGIVVISLRFWRKPSPSAEMRGAYLKTSREQILLQCVDSCTVVSTQAFALLAIDAIGQGPGPRTWNIMAMLIAASQQLGLARISTTTSSETTVSMVRNEDPEDGLETFTIEAEEKRRLFWLIYSLDRFSSVSHGQLGGIETKTIKQRLPANDKDWCQSITTEWFQAATPVRSTPSANLWRCYIDLLALVDRSNQLLIQPVNLSLSAHCQEWQSNFRLLDISLCTWFENLPKEIRETPDTLDPMWIMVHATFYLITIRMHTVAAFPSTNSSHLRPSQSARGRCRQAIRSVACLSTRIQPHELDQLGPPFAFIVWVAARSLMILWTTGYETTYGTMPADLEALLGVLRQMATRWQCAQRYADIIQFILDTKNKPDGTTGLNIFNDTRRTAYGLQNRLGSLAKHRATRELDSFDFLDMPILDDAELMPRIGTFVPEIDGEWL